MVTKPVVLGVLLASFPLCFLAAVQDPNPGQVTATSLNEQISSLRTEVGRLRAAVDAARTKLEGAQTEVGDLRRQLEECLDMLAQDSQPQHRNCTPSRASLTYFQWLDRNGHPQRAESMLERAVAENGGEPRRLASMARELMNSEETAGKFDRAALALAQRLLQSGKDLDARTLDTVAMAHFLNGRFDQAVHFERRAAEGNNGGDYRGRLRLYEAALRNMAQPTAAVAVVAAGGE